MAGLDDAFTVSLLHFDGADAGTTITDESGKVWTAQGNAQIDNAQSVFNNTSLVLDGTGDYITTPDHADWRLDGGSNSNKWTIDFRVRFNGDPGTAIVGFAQQRASDAEHWALVLNNNSLQFYIRTGAVNTVSILNAWNPATAIWYHVACVKDGTNGYMMFVDGTQVGTTQTDVDPMPDFAGELRLGLQTSGTGVNNFLNGWLDEVRISKGVARWTANFTAPTIEYAQDKMFLVF